MTIVLFTDTTNASNFVPPTTVRSTVSQLPSLTNKIFYSILASEWLNPSHCHEKKLSGVYPSVTQALSAKDVKLEEVFTPKYKTGYLHAAHKVGAGCVRVLLMYGSMVVISPIGVVCNGLRTLWYVCKAFRQWSQAENSKVPNESIEKIKLYAKATFVDLCHTVAAYCLFGIACAVVWARDPTLWMENGLGEMTSSIHKTLYLKKKFGIVDERGNALTTCVEDDENFHVNSNQVIFTGALYRQTRNALVMNVRKEMALLCYVYNILAKITVESNLDIETGVQKFKNKVKETFVLESNYSTKEIDDIIRSYCKSVQALIEHEKLRKENYAVRESNIFKSERVVVPYPTMLNKPLFEEEFMSFYDPCVHNKNIFLTTYPELFSEEGKPPKLICEGRSPKILIDRLADPDMSARSLLGFQEEEVLTKEIINTNYKKLHLSSHPDKLDKKYHYLFADLRNVLKAAKKKLLEDLE